MSSIITTHTLTEDVIRYCEAHGLVEALETALRLADECFGPIERLEVTIEPDPEVENEESVVIDLWIKNTVADALARKSAYTRQWINSVPTNVLGRINLLFYLI